MDRLQGVYYEGDGINSFDSDMDDPAPMRLACPSITASAKGSSHRNIAVQSRSYSSPARNYTNSNYPTKVYLKMILTSKPDISNWHHGFPSSLVLPAWNRAGPV